MFDMSAQKTVMEDAVREARARCKERCELACKPHEEQRDAEVAKIYEDWRKKRAPYVEQKERELTQIDDIYQKAIFTRSYDELGRYLLEIARIGAHGINVDDAVAEMLDVREYVGDGENCDE